MAGLIFVMPVPCEQVRTKGISKVGSGLFALFPRRSIFLRRPHDVEVVKQPVFGSFKGLKRVHFFTPGKTSNKHVNAWMVIYRVIRCSMQ